MELASREVGHLVAEDFLEKSVRGAFETFETFEAFEAFEAFEVRRDADEAPVRIAAAEASRQARAPLDAALGFEVGTSQRWSQRSRDWRQGSGSSAPNRAFMDR